MVFYCLKRTSSYECQKPSKYFQTKFWSLFRAPLWDSFEEPYLWWLIFYKLQARRLKTNVKEIKKTKQSKATVLPTVLQWVIDDVKKNGTHSLDILSRKQEMGWRTSSGPFHSLESDSCWILCDAYCLLDPWLSHAARGMVSLTCFHKIFPS